MLGLVAVIVGAFTIANALSMSVTQQTRSLALLRAVGASRRQVRRLVALQALALGVVGSLVGLAAGLASPTRSARFRRARVSLPTTAMALSSAAVSRRWWSASACRCWPSLRPARLATRISPASAMVEAVDGPKVGIVGRGVRALASVLGRPAEWFGGVAGGLARRNAMRRPGRTAATAAALTIGVTLVAAVSIIAAGLKGAVKTEVTDRVTADIVVGSETDGWGPTSPEALKRVAAVSGVERVGAMSQDRAKVGGQESRSRASTRAGASMLRYKVSSGSGDAAAWEGARRARASRVSAGSTSVTA